MSAEPTLHLSVLILGQLGTASLVLIGAGLIGAVVGSFLAWYGCRESRRRAERTAREIIESARRKGALIADEFRSQAEIEIERRRAELRNETERQEMEIEAALAEIRSHEESIGSLDHQLTLRERQLEQQSAAVEEDREAVAKMSRDLRRTMENLANLDVNEIKEGLREEVRRECADELHELRRDVLERSERDLQREARGILISAMQRLTSKPTNDITATIVQLPNDDMKGRIIGREGRNIKCFEAATGTTLLIDESPQMVLISSFDPVRRQVAKIALERLIEDGRIHPASIEEGVREAHSEVAGLVEEAGEDAIRTLKLASVHPEVIQLVGKLKFRHSFTQNALDHSIEVARLCSLIASELGLDPAIAKRAGLFHDLGKAIDAEYEGSHALIGAEFLKRLGEDPVVVNAVAAHHEEVKPESLYAGLVILADTISAVRPGARAELMSSYIERLERLEKLALSIEGVQGAYAIQAGREIRAVVHPTTVTDEQASAIARTLRRRIEDELQYPSTIKVTVIREQRFIETAK
ncbi:MAG: ribonuclease Y [Opitutaceae bacterium]